MPPGTRESEQVRPGTIVGTVTVIISQPGHRGAACGAAEPLPGNLVDSVTCTDHTVRSTQCHTVGPAGPCRRGTVIGPYGPESESRPRPGPDSKRRDGSEAPRLRAPGMIQCHQMIVRVRSRSQAGGSRGPGPGPGPSPGRGPPGISQSRMGIQAIG
eukprot:747206-Hanusia_phi.AAC.1